MKAEIKNKKKNKKQMKKKKKKKNKKKQKMGASAQHWSFIVGSPHYATLSAYREGKNSGRLVWKHDFVQNFDGTRFA